MNVVIHHNPDCGTSRNVVEIVRAAGYEPVIIEYLKTGCRRMFADDCKGRIETSKQPHILIHAQPR